MRIPLFVSAAGILTVIAIGFAFTLRALSATYHRRYVRDWQHAWTALALYAATSGLALLAVNIPVLADWRRVFALLAIASAWWHLTRLGAGIRDLCTGDAPSTRLAAWRERLLDVLLLSAAALLLVPAAPRSDLSLQLYLWRVSLLAAAWGLAYASAGWMIIQRYAVATTFARGTLGSALIAYALLRILEPLTHALGPTPILAQFLTFGGIPILVAMGAGMLMTLLEEERARSLAETEARGTAERTANATEALLATALASSTDPVIVVDPNGEILAFNARFGQLAQLATGHDAQVGMRIEALMANNTLSFWRDAFARAMGGESQLRHETFVLSPDEPPRRFGVRVTPVRRDGMIIGVLIVAHDTTEEERLRGTLARREEWFRSMIENASDIIFQVSPEGTLEYASPSVSRLLGHDPDAIVGESAFEYVHSEDVAALRDAMERTFAGDESVPTTVPFRARTAAGDYVHLEAVSRPYAEADGTPRLMVSARDVRERRRLETELLSARRLEAVGRLAGGVAHDFNNLLTAVVGNLTLLREGVPQDSPIRGNVEEIEHAVQRGAELTRRLLAFARRQMIEPKLVEPAAQVRDLERLIRRLLGEQIALELALPEGLWTIRVDPTALEQILVNLVVNARDAMPDGGSLSIRGANVTVGNGTRSTLGLPDGDWLRLDVTDTGVGIDEAVVGQIFEPFFTTKERSGGTGLGLATVYGAVTQAGGQLRVQSVVGRGTTFALFFPRVVTPTTAPRPRGTPPRAQDGETILLMEDEAPVREVTTKLLTRLGYRVVTATDGLDGIEVARAHTDRLDLIVSDLMMPGLGGIEAVARIRGERPTVPVIFISGFSEEALQRRGTLTEVGKLLSKPFSVHELAVAVREAIDNEELLA